MRFPLIAALLGGALDVLAPEACAACDTPLGTPGPFCRDCLGAAAPPPADDRLASDLRVVAAAAYGGPVARAVQRLKYEGRPDLARPLGTALARALSVHEIRATLVVPVPLHPGRLAARGYNQSALLGGVVARTLGWRFAPRALARRRATAEQASLGRADRLRNLESAFEARGQLRGETVVILDDVVTTGATAEACARAVEAAGARVAVVAAIARA